MPDNESSSSDVQEAPVNCWQYSRDVYLIGRSLKMRPFTEDERAAVIEFIKAMAGTRPAYIPYINLKAENPPANEFKDVEPSSSGSEEGAQAERELVWDLLKKQNDYSLAKMVQKIGRSLKVQFCTAEEKEICDALFEATDAGTVEVDGEEVPLRRFQKYYVEEESSGSSEEDESSSSEEDESSSSEENESSSSEEGESSSSEDGESSSSEDGESSSSEENESSSSEEGESSSSGETVEP